jgi:F-type H+-transporting ATPase subunit delta
MQGVSASSLAVVLGGVREVLNRGAEPAALGQELFALVDLLDAQPTLRRLLTDPSVDVEAKTELIRQLLEGKVSRATGQVLVLAVGRRWHANRDLADALEHAGVTSYVAAADQAGQLDELDDELFRFGRIVEAAPALRDALSDRSAPLTARRRLLQSLLQDKASEPAQRLLAEALAARHPAFTAAIAAYQDIAAGYRDRLVATVRVAAPLSSRLEQRLAAALHHQYGHAVDLNVIVDPTVLGGVRVLIGDEVIDSTVATRLEDARRRLAG